MKHVFTYNNTKGGFIALVSTLVISAVLMVLMFSVNTSSFYARFDALGGEYKRTALGLSESCVNAALLKVAQNYNYTLAAGGETVAVGPDLCVIRAVTYGLEDPITHRKLATIRTDAQYPVTGGAWSTVKVEASVRNPAYLIAIPPPTCTVLASPASIPAGQLITVQWSASSNATSFELTPTPAPAISNPAEAQSGSRTFTAGGVGPVTYTGVAFNSFGVASADCTSTVTVTAPPPSPACADTVMMMDRTNSTSGFQTQMGNAVKALLNLYNTLSPAPQVGIGDYGAVTETNKNLYGSNYNFYAEIPNGSVGASPTTLISGLLTNNYGSEGIITPAPVNTGNLAPTGEGNFKDWTVWINNKIDSKKAVEAILNNDGDTKYISKSNLTNTGGDAYTFKIPNAGVGAGSTINSVTLYAVVAKTIAVGNPTIKLRVEKGTQANNIKDDPISYILTDTNYSIKSWQMVNNPFTNAPWTLNEVTNWTIRFGVFKPTNTGTAKVTQIYVVVNYTGPATSAGTRLYKTATEIYAHGTSGGGTSNLSDGVRVGNIELNRTTPITDITGVISNGHDITKEKVLIFVADGKPDFPKDGLPQNNIPACNSLTSDSGKRYACEQLYKTSDEAKLSGTKIFSIYFGNANTIQQNIMTQISSGSDYFFISPTAEAMAGIFETVGRLACPALAPACSNTIDDDGDGLIDTNDPSCHTDENAANSASYDPNDNDEWTAPDPPNPPDPPPLPLPIDIGSWDEIINVFL